MKIKGQTRRGAVGSTKGQQATTTPAVIALPDGTAEAAKAVIAASETPPGPVSNTESKDLHEAATMVRPEPTIETVPVEHIEDATFEDVTDAEKAAQTLLDQLDAEDKGETTKRPIDVLFEGEKSPPHTEWANGSYVFLSEGGQKLLNWLCGLKKDTVKLFTQLKLRAIAFGNSAVDYAKKLGNKLWKLHDDWKKNPAAPYIWLKARQEEIAAWASKTYASLQMFWRESLQGNTVAIQELTQVILDLKELHEQELRRMSKRITSLETQLGKNTRATIRLSNVASPVDADQLKTLLTAMSQNRKVDTINLVRAITGGSLADAKAMVAEASATIN